MAAFIQKLFKSRKTHRATSHRTPPKSESSQPVEVDHRKVLREAQEQQLASNPGQPELAELAIDGVTASIRLEAAKGLREETLLQHVQKNAKGRDKGVYQAVRQALQVLREQQASEAATRQRISDLVSQARDQAASENTKLFKARLETLQENWRAVESSAATEQVQQFLEAVHQCRERLQQMDQARLDEERHQEQARQRLETLELLERTLADLRHPNPTNFPRHLHWMHSRKRRKTVGWRPPGTPPSTSRNRKLTSSTCLPFEAT